VGACFRIPQRSANIPARCTSRRFTKAKRFSDQKLRIGETVAAVMSSPMGVGCPSPSSVGPELPYRPGHHDWVASIRAGHLRSTCSAVRDHGRRPSGAASAWRHGRAAGLVKLLALASGHWEHREQVIEALWPHLPPEGGKRNLTCRSLVLIYSQLSGEAHRLSCLPDVTTLVFIDLHEILGIGLVNANLAVLRPDRYGSTCCSSASSSSDAG
jgi:hypothetical protein